MCPRASAWEPARHQPQLTWEWLKMKRYRNQQANRGPGSCLQEGVYRFYGCWTNLLHQVLNCLPDGSCSPLTPVTKTSAEEEKKRTTQRQIHRNFSSFLSFKLTTGALQIGWGWTINTCCAFWDLKRNITAKRWVLNFILRLIYPLNVLHYSWSVWIKSPQIFKFI